MQLYELIGLLNDNRTAIIKENGNEVARYDGRDSIPNRYNDYEVVEINIEDSAFVIDIAVPDHK